MTVLHVGDRTSPDQPNLLAAASAVVRDAGRTSGVESPQRGSALSGRSGPARIREVDMSRAHARAWRGAVPDQVVVAGIHPRQDLRVLGVANDLARRLGVGLVGVWVDPSRVVVGHEANGSLDLTPLDPDGEDLLGEVPTADDLEAHVAGQVAAGVSWRFVYTAGEVAPALAAVCHDYDVALVVVGSRRPGLGGWMNEVIGGSVAGRLAHTQSVPVVVVPLPGDPR
jgi:nucleotide-binding universal stress UspA family protein